MSQEYTKHPAYGYLTKEEYEQMKSSSFGRSKDFISVAKKRESIAKRKALEEAKKNRNSTIRT